MLPRDRGGQKIKSVLSVGGRQEEDVGREGRQVPALPLTGLCELERRA